MSKASKARNKMKRKQYKANLKAQKKALYEAQSAAGKKKGTGSHKKLDPNRYGKLWIKASRNKSG